MGRLHLGYNLHLTRGVMVADFSSLKTMFGNFARRASLFSSKILFGGFVCTGCAKYANGLGSSLSTTNSVQKHSKVFTCSSCPYSMTVLYLWPWVVNSKVLSP